MVSLFIYVIFNVFTVVRALLLSFDCSEKTRGRIDYTEQKFIYHSDRFWKSEIREPAWSVEDSLLCLHMIEGAQKLHGVSFYTLIPFMQAFCL